MQRLGVDDRVAPLVERDALGQQLGAHAVGLAGDRVDAHALAHRSDTGSWVGVAVGRWTGSGSSPGRAQPSQGPWRAWSANSAANASSALVTKRAVPSG